MKIIILFSLFRCFLYTERGSIFGTQEFRRERRYSFGRSRSDSAKEFLLKKKCSDFNTYHKRSFFLLFSSDEVLLRLTMRLQPATATSLLEAFCCFVLDFERRKIIPHRRIRFATLQKHIGQN